MQNRRVFFVQNVPWSNINDFDVDLRPGSDTYAEVLGVEVFREVGDKEGKNPQREEITYHGTRAMPWVFPDIDGTNPWGMSPLKPVMDIITIKKNADWSLGEALFQYAVGKFFAIAPPTMPDDKFKDFADDFKDFDISTTYAVRGEGFDIKEMSPQRAALNPDPYTRYFMSLASIGLGVPYAILFRGLTGGVGQEIRRDYASDIADMQRDDIEPFLVELLNRTVPGNVAIWEIKWHPIFELTEEEQSRVRSRIGLARELESKAVVQYQSTGLTVEFNKDGWIDRVFITGEGDELILEPPEPSEEPEIPGSQPTTPPVPPGEEPGEPEVDVKRDLIEEMVREIRGDPSKKTEGVDIYSLDGIISRYALDQFCLPSRRREEGVQES